MPYRIWFGSARTPVEFQSMRRHWVARQRDTLHDALWDAMMIETSGHELAWEIQGDDGTRLGRPKLLDLIHQRRAELLANPPRSESETASQPIMATVAAEESHPQGSATVDPPALRAWRAGRGLTVAAAADLLGVNPLTLQDLEAGRAPGSALWGPIGRILEMMG